LGFFSVIWKDLMINKLNKSFGFVLHSVLLTLTLFAFTETVLADQTPEKPASCKIKRERLEENIEKYRRGKTPFVDDKSYFMFCRSARPVLEKYNLDANPMIRNTIAEFLSYTFSKFNMRLLIAQIEKYPLKSPFAVFKLTYYKCKDLHKLKTKKLQSLKNALIERTQSGDPELFDEYTRALLKCLAEQNKEKRQKRIIMESKAQQINGREGETATLLSRCPLNSNGLGGGFAPRHLSR
jgi:hypothetical protein